MPAALKRLLIQPDIIVLEAAFAVPLTVMKRLVVGIARLSALFGHFN